MKKPTQHFIAEVPRRSSKVGMTIGIDLGDVWSHYCTLNEDGEVVDRGRFRTSPSGVEKVVYRSASGADRDGSGHALDLDQRAASGTGSRSDRGERARTACDLAQRSEERSGGCGEAGSICAARSEDPASDCPSYGRSAGSTDVDPRPQPDRSSADSGSERGAVIGQALRLRTSVLVHILLRQDEFGR